MDIFNSNVSALCLVAAAAVLTAAVGYSQETFVKRVLQMTPAEQAAVVKAALDQGLPEKADVTEGLIVLVRSNSGLAIPAIEARIEEVLHSPDPSNLFTTPGVKPEWFVATAAGTIAYAGNRDALASIDRLLRSDRKRFGHLVSEALYSALTFGNPFRVVYQGYDIASPDLNLLISEWASKVLSAPSAPYVEHRQLAEAMIDRYGAIPTESQWNADAIVTRLPPERALAMHDHVMKLAADAWAKRKAADK